MQVVPDVHQGNGKHAMRPLHHEPESDGLDLWNLASTWATGALSSFGRWQSGERRLAVAFNVLTEDELESFCKTLELRRVEVPGKGVYENVTLADVPVGPVSAQDAQRWAMARFNRHLSAKPGYRSRGEVRAKFVELTENTALEAFAPTLPSHDDFLSQSSKDPERYWSPAAPVDLSPFPAVMEELGPLRIGTPAPITATEPPRVVRVPHRGGWSMRKLVDRLLSGVAPRRVLLCDRYVRGDDNLDLAHEGLLSRSLRNAGRNAKTPPRSLSDAP